MINPWIPWGGLVLAASTMVYSLMARLAVAMRIRASARPLRRMPPVTIFKPLCGAEPETYECLRSFCDQDFPDFQVIFGVADSSDPVLPIVERLKREFPQREIEIVIDRRQHGNSRKVSNLINMMPFARHEFFVISDSDVRVGRDYLSRVVAPLISTDVGIVTCLYRGVPRPGLWSLLGSQFINE